MFELSTKKIFSDLLTKNAKGLELISNYEEFSMVDSANTEVNFNVMLDIIYNMKNKEEIFEKVYGPFTLFSLYEFKPKPVTLTVTIPKTEWKDWILEWNKLKKQLLTNATFVDGDNVVASFFYWGGR